MGSWKLDINEYEAIARSVVSEGAVLLLNEKNCLPYSHGEKVAVFGRMQNNYYKSGTGSGGMVNAPKSTTLLQALLRSPKLTVHEGLKKAYEDWEEKNPVKEGVGWGTEPWSQEEMPLADSFVSAIRKESDCALCIIARTAGEDRDNHGGEGSFQLSEGEKNMLAVVCAAFTRVAVVLNVGNVIDMSFLDEYHPQACLLAWQGGMMGAEGTVDVLDGTVNPSGHLTDTIAMDVRDYPADANFGDLKRNFYREDIYVGYRYFESVAKEKVRFPFGYGLSYTTFTYEVKRAGRDGDLAEAEVLVSNTGAVAGKAVAELYLSAPQGKLGKPAIVLTAFAKTKLLAPGETEVLTLTCGSRDFASYDDFGGTGHEACFVLEAGEYRMFVGPDARELKLAGVFELAETEVVEELSSAMKPVLPFERMKLSVDQEGNLIVGTEAAPLEVCELARKVTPEISYKGDQGYQLADVFEGRCSLEEFVSQLTDEDLACLVRGEGMGSARVTAGTASAFGGVNEHLVALGVPCACCSDGPSGMRLDSGNKAFSLPIGTLIACTYNLPLITKLYEKVGIEMRKNKVDSLLGPGMNIHRHPYNGRNFEYFSEDPLVTGKVATAELTGLHMVGVTGTLKHFCCNNQEQNRYTTDSVVSERALREIYLRGFEIAVREGMAFLIMTTYGRVNGWWTATSYELTKTILRDQWEFSGAVMTDWWAALNVDNRFEEAGSAGSKVNFALMVKAENDMYMCCPDSSKNAHGDNTMEALQEGLLTRGELTTAATHILMSLMNLPTMERAMGEKTSVEVIGQTKEWEQSINEDVTYFDVSGEDVTIPLENVDTGRGQSFAYGLTLSKMGGYRLEFTAKAEGPEAAQMPCTLFCSGIPMKVFTWNGTNGASVTKSVNVYFNSNFAIHRLYFGQGGLTLCSMRLVYDKSLEEAMKDASYCHG